MKLVAIAVVTLATTLVPIAQAAGLVTGMGGQATVRRTAVAIAVPLHVGVQLNDSDQVLLAPGSFVEVLCGGLTRVSLREPVQVFRCPSGKSVFNWNGKDMPSPRSITRVLLPAGTLVMSQRPPIRWTPGNTASQVRVMVRGGDFRWERLVPDTGSLPYPADAPPLERGHAYRALVLDPDADPDMTSGPLNSGFKVLGEDEAKQAEFLLAELDALKGLSPAEILQLKSRARLLIGLNAEAIELIERASEDPVTALTASSMLGTAWLRTGCVACAVPVLEKTLEKASATGDAASIHESGRLLLDVYRKQNRNSAAEAVEKQLNASQ